MSDENRETARGDEGPAFTWNDEKAAHPGGPQKPETNGENAAPRFTRTAESLALRAPPPRVVRFRRGLLIAAAAGTLALVAAVSWFALDPPGLRLPASDRDLAPVGDETDPEALDGLPKTYAASRPPILGPPLPGDLGRPILAHQRAMAEDEALPAEVTPSRDPGANADAGEHQRIAAELVQARTAPILMPVSRSADGSAADRSPAGSDAAPAVPDDGGINPNRLRQPSSRWQIVAGSTISANLVTGLNSDLPGLVVAQVSEAVRDSATGRAILVPQGARLLGRYASKVAFGQRRAMVVWQRLVMPDGSSIALDNAPATDAAGFAGVADQIDLHTWQLLKGIGLSTVLGVGSELSFGKGEGDLIRALRQSVQAGADQAGQKLVERHLDVAPTITVRPGFPVRVLVHKDLVLPPWTGIADER